MLEEEGFNPVDIVLVVPEHEVPQGAVASSGGRPCMECDCCKFWTGVVDQLTDESACTGDAIQKLQANVSALERDNEWLKKANKRLNAENNNIKTVPDKTGPVPVRWADRVGVNLPRIRAQNA